jgi:hypothetical protein
MALIHENSPLVSPSELELGQLPASDAAYIETYFTPNRPKNNATSGGQIEIEITGNPDEYPVVNPVYLSFILWITRRNGDNLDPRDVFSVVNNAAHAIWESIVVEVGGQIVSPNSLNYGQKANLGIMLNYGPDPKNSHLETGIFSADKAGYMDTMSTDNTGFAARAGPFAQSKRVACWIPLDLDIFNINKVLPTNLDIRITLNRTRDAVVILAPTQQTVIAAAGALAAREAYDTDFKTNVADTTVWMRKARLDPDVMMGHHKMFATSNAFYRISRVTTKSYVIPTGVRSHTIDGAFGGQLPKRILYTLVRNDAYNGVYNLNPFNYQHANVSQTAVYVNGKCHPHVPFTPVYGDDNPNWTREYRALHDALGIYHGNKGLGIKWSDFPNGYCVYAVDISPNQRAGQTAAVNLIRGGDVKIEFQFSAGHDHAMNCVVYAEFDNLIEIDKDRNVHLTYAPGK